MMTAMAAPEIEVSLPCQEVDPELFFSDQPVEIELAKDTCRGCPLRRECLAGALERQEPHGVWGGELFHDGAVIAQKRRRGRPRKNPEPLFLAPGRAA